MRGLVFERNVNGRSSASRRSLLAGDLFAHPFRPINRSNANLTAESYASDSLDLSCNDLRLKFDLPQGAPADGAYFRGRLDLEIVPLIPRGDIQ
jgi:hypothetical protein